MSTIDLLIEQAKVFAETPVPNYKFEPDTPVGSGFWQGDLGVELVNEVPAGYVEYVNPNACLVYGNSGTIGSQHNLSTMEGVTWFKPPSNQPLLGPCLVVGDVDNVVINHPRHGSIELVANSVVAVRYQREYDYELRQERINAD